MSWAVGPSHAPRPAGSRVSDADGDRANQRAEEDVRAESAPFRGSSCGSGGRPTPPTSVPATMSRLLSRVKPWTAATAKPGERVQERDQHRHVGPADGEANTAPSTRHAAGQEAHATTIDEVTDAAITSTTTATPDAALKRCWLQDK